MLGQQLSRRQAEKGLLWVWFSLLLFRSGSPSLPWLASPQFEREAGS